MTPLAVGLRLSDGRGQPARAHAVTRPATQLPAATLCGLSAEDLEVLWGLDWTESLYGVQPCAACSVRAREIIRAAQHQAMRSTEVRAEAQAAVDRTRAMRDHDRQQRERLEELRSLRD